MTQPRRWRDTGHRERTAETAGSPEASTPSSGRFSTRPEAGDWPNYASGENSPRPRSPHGSPRSTENVPLHLCAQQGDDTVQ